MTLASIVAESSGVLESDPVLLRALLNVVRVLVLLVLASMHINAHTLTLLCLHLCPLLL